MFDEYRLTSTYEILWYFVCADQPTNFCGALRVLTLPTGFCGTFHIFISIFPRVHGIRVILEILSEQKINKT